MKCLLCFNSGRPRVWRSATRVRGCRDRNAPRSAHARPGRVDGSWFAGGRLSDFLIATRSSPALIGRQRHWPAGVRGGKDRFDHPDVQHAFFTRRLRRGAVQDAAREVDEFGSELIALLEALLFGLFLNRQVLGVAVGVFERWLQSQIALVAGNAIARDTGNAVADAKMRESVVRKLEQYRYCVVRSILLNGVSEDLDRFRTEQVTSRIDAI